MIAAILFVAFYALRVVLKQPQEHEDPWEKDENDTFVQNASALPYNGIDISERQGYVDWQSVSMDHLVDFVYLKATEGLTHVDSRYMANVKSAYNFGFLIGSYHRFHSKESTEGQFFNFNKHVDHAAQHLIPMVELDEKSISGWTHQQVQDSLALFAWLVNDFYGSLPIIRTTLEFYDTYLYPRFEDFPLFIMDENEKQPKVRSRHFYMWRHDNPGFIPGVINDVHMDSFTSGTALHDIYL
ncbi:MAG: glycosyl hydrolase family 25 [Prevotella sp.]|nr:glycosyl hydrolase family 25 [Prevotella sp.]